MMNKLSQNFEKTKFMLFGPSSWINHMQLSPVKIGVNEIENISKFKYLGVI